MDTFSVVFYETLSGEKPAKVFLNKPMAFGVFSQYGPITVLGQKYLAKNAGFASGITLGLGITLGGLVAPYVGHLADIYGVQTALMTLIPVGLMGLLMSLWLKEPK